MEQPQLDTLDLRDYLAVLRRRRWIVVQTVVVVVAVALAVTFSQTPRYEAKTRLVVENNTGSSDAAVLRSLVYGERELETQKELVTSEPVAQRVIETLGMDTTLAALTRNVTVSRVRDTQIIEIRAESTSPTEAATISQTFADEYLLFRQEQALEDLLRATESLTKRESETRDRLRQVDLEIAGATGSALAALEREQEALSSDLAQIAAQKAIISGNEVFARSGGQIVQAATVPEEPFAPKPARTGVLALVLGLMLGVGLAFLRDFLDDAIRTEDQAVRATGRPVLGYVPHWETENESETRLVSLVEPSSPVAESYRTLRTNIRFLSVGRSFRSLLVTSSLPQEGKTTTSANLAIALARAGTRVLLVGADMRRASMHKAFGLEASPGLSDVLVGEAELVEAITDVGVPNLRVIPAGQTAPNPAELLGSPAMAQLMSELEQIADLVIYDGPPILAVADTLEVAPKVGGVLLVIDVGSTGRHAVKSSVERMTGVGVEISGVVLNNLDPSDGYYGYTYYHSYAPDAEEPKPGRRATRSRATAKLS